MIYNTRNHSNDTAETQKEKRPVSMLMLEESEIWLSNAYAKKYGVVIKNLSYIKGWELN